MLDDLFEEQPALAARLTHSLLDILQGLAPQTLFFEDAECVLLLSTYLFFLFSFIYEPYPIVFFLLFKVSEPTRAAAGVAFAAVIAPQRLALCLPFRPCPRASSFQKNSFILFI